MSTESHNTVIEINGQYVSYERFGSGPKILLLIPDAIGTGSTDFESLLEGENALDFTEYTVIAVEAPGWGRSRPAERKYGPEVYNIDSECFHHLMRRLGYKKLFSVMGWGEGAKSALMMAIKYPAKIQTLILLGMSYLNSETAVKHMNSLKSVDNWSEERLECCLKVYESQEQIQKLWQKYTSFYRYFGQYFPNDAFTKQCHKIECPVLLVFGEKDPLMDVKQIDNLSKVIKGAKVHRLSNGGHDYHVKNCLQFKRLFDEYMFEITSIDNNMYCENMEVYVG